MGMDLFSRVIPRQSCKLKGTDDKGLMHYVCTIEKVPKGADTKYYLQDGSLDAMVELVTDKEGKILGGGPSATQTVFHGDLEDIKKQQLLINEALKPMVGKRIQDFLV